MKQTTIGQATQLSGVGLHTGAKVTLQFEPAPAGHGIKFQRVDLEDEPTVNADVKQVHSTDRSTTIKQGEAVVSTVEHLMSALSGLQIDNLLIKLDGPEIPILDGSAKPFVETLRKVGKIEQEEDRQYFVVEEPISFLDPETGSELIALPHDGFDIRCMIDFDSPVLGQQYATLNDLDEYANEIAPCRTFVFLHELEVLFDQDMIKGGDLNNAIVIADRHIPQDRLDKLAKRMNKESVAVTEYGILNTLDLHYHNEPARHKLLDIMGDIALLGVPIKGRILATKPGHSVNAEFTKLLKEAWIDQRRLKGKPVYNPNDEPVFDLEGIKRYMPHRHPFLLIDKIIELGDDHIVGLKNLTGNEAFFQGHFPNQPVMPGVLQIEAMAQTGGLLVLSQRDEPGNWDTYFLKIEKAKFKSFVVPGDTLLIKMELTAPVRRGIVQMVGTCYVGNRIVSEAELIAQIVKRS
ncbi:MAG: bifunctional UDP-3-O-[3-hydroxymyristoyl] N-acetylglucosamine deacetylase/3-hydroxyacyl-ACP dehydratase [Bacteroidota bacterium]